ncbi:MAG TPA: dienelactone hydrolase family protein [Bacteroidales bacterium]|nr:dienelactone hydrolase family protein [Bacteroidales bacterium]
MEKNIRDLYTDYRKGGTDRRTFLKKLGILTGSSYAAASLIPVLESGYPFQDDDLVTEFIKYPAETGDMKAFMAHPKNGRKFPGVIVIHENRGLVPHIQDVTRRMAREGFLALAPDALTPVGGTPADVINAGELFKKLVPEQTTKNFVAAVKYLKTNPLCTGKVGCTGFCWGGAMTNQVAVNSPDLDAAVPYYGMQPSEQDVEKIKAPIMAHYAGNDERIDAGIPAFESALKKYGKEYQIFMYPGAGHAFNNDSNPERYNAEAAKLAWGRTVGFFKEKLK